MNCRSRRRRARCHAVKWKTCGHTVSLEASSFKGLTVPSPIGVTKIRSVKFQILNSLTSVPKLASKADAQWSFSSSSLSYSWRSTPYYIFFPLLNSILRYLCLIPEAVMCMWRSALCISPQELIIRLVPFVFMFSALALAWVTLNIAGQWCMLLLLGTFLLVKDLPGRRNVFMINFLVTIFLGTIPPCLLFYAGQQDGVPSHWLCLMQSVLMDGIAPMFGVALTVFVFQTWAELRSAICSTTSLVATSQIARWGLLLLPYMTLAGWCTGSLFQAFLPPATFQLSEFVYCDNISGGRVGYFMIACGTMEILFEIWIAFLLITRDKLSTGTIRPEKYRDTVHLYIRTITFTLVQFGPVALAVMNKVAPPTIASEIQSATQVLEAMNALATFLVFGSQKAILQTWKIWPQRRIRTLTQSRVDVAGAMA
ncbi:hypothetical protein JB92DRAFT_3043827 [Gautieria morchelliformis]|nr:hypothetical protein JB92DRAFT_3043827 [Gautieria morchelliformis]